ncbi:OsmC family protein [Acrocarpospora catenulata]|uniref:OsmC family protein n=1 Tax=Acrocarpospora catenulata TaxID=2836182 RepID=UPI001BDAF886|nr:OsmC family protein [Acrocarpospora catenulata]
MTPVHVERTPSGEFVASNERGASVKIGSVTQDGVFSPVELLLIAVGACNLVTVEPLTAQRGHRLPRLAMSVTAEKAAPTLLESVTVTYEVELPESLSPEKFAEIAERVHHRHCTVTRSLEHGTPVKLNLPTAGDADQLSTWT